MNHVSVLRPPSVVPGRALFLLAIATLSLCQSVLGQTKSALQSEPKPSLVGTWRLGAAEGEFVFDNDGSFFEFQSAAVGRTSVVRNADGAQEVVREAPSARTTTTYYTNVQGRWALSGDTLELTKTAETSSAQWLRGQRAPDGNPERVPEVRIFKIVLLEDSHLRVVELVAGGTESPTRFYRRAGHGIDKRLDPSIPEAYQKLAQVLDLPPEEVDVVIQWHKASNVENPRWEVIERMLDARRGKLDLPGLFELTPEEGAAYKNLLELTRGRQATIDQLALENQLTPTEQSAAKKVQAFKAEFDKFVLPSPTRRAATESGPRPSQWPPRYQKITTELNSWLASTVFDEPPPPRIRRAAAAPARGGVILAPAAVEGFAVPAPADPPAR